MKLHFKNAFRSKIKSYFLSVIAIGATALLFKPLATSENYHVVSFILLFVVSILSTFQGIGPVLLAATLSALVWNFFFIPPHHTFNIEKTEDILIFSLFFIIAFINGVLTTRVRRQEKLTREREKRTNALFQLTRELSKASGLDEVLRAASSGVRKSFRMQPVFFLQDGDNKLNHNAWADKEAEAVSANRDIAVWAFNNSSIAGSNTGNYPSERLTYYPMAGTKLNPGIIAVRQDQPFINEQKSYWDTFLAQISNALEREFLGELAQKVRFLDESDRLYKTLFNSISHELRIPVATIMGASDSILNSPDQGTIQSALCREIFTASLRLNRLIENLLNMSRLESGHISVRMDWCDVNDLINKVTEDLKDDLEMFSFEVFISDQMPLIMIDFGLMEQVLYNLLLNSTQYAPESTEIKLDIYYRENKAVFEISDKGPGFPEEQLTNVFRKFFRVKRSKTGGLGLGLSIVKGFTEAHNGTISVENNSEGGAKFRIEIPSEEPDINYL